MSSDNHSTFTMNAKIANASLKRYFEAENIAGSSKKVKTSVVNTLVKIGAMDDFCNPEAVFEKMENATYRHKGVMKKYNEESIRNFGKTVSKIAQYLPEDAKVEILDQYYDAKGDHNSKNKKLYHNKEQKLDNFRVNIIDEYKAYNGAKSTESMENNIEQKMNPRQTEAYQPRDVLLKKLLDLAKRFTEERDLNSSARSLYQYQFVVVCLIDLLAEKNRRLDIAFTMLQDGDEVNVILRDNEEYGIFIKKTNKTRERKVFLPFKDKRLIDAVNILVEHRRKNNKTQLFLKENGDSSKNHSKWFGESFTKVMKTLGVGENLTMGVFRMAYGIHLSEHHDGTAISKKKIEEAMGHSWKVHQLKYNLTALNNGEVDMEDSSDRE